MSCVPRNAALVLKYTSDSQCDLPDPFFCMLSGRTFTFPADAVETSSSNDVAIDASTFPKERLIKINRKLVEKLILVVEGIPIELIRVRTERYVC